MKNNVIQTIQGRKSIRRFVDTQISEDDLKEIIKTGIKAPSAGNRQPWRIVIVRNNERLERLAMAALGQSFIAQASVALVICAVPEESAERYGERGATLYALQDTAAMTQNILLASHALGYGSCWVGAFNEDDVRKVLSIPEGMRPVSIIPIGNISGEVPKDRPRKSIDEVIIKEEF